MLDRQSLPSPTLLSQVRRRPLSPQIPRRWPSVLWWLALFALGVGCLVLVGVRVGERAGHPSGWLADLGVAISKPVVTSFVASALVILILGSFRRLWFETLAWWPGPVYVQDLTRSDDAGTVDPAYLTGEFRRRLTGLRLQAAPAMPSALPEADFLAVLADRPTTPGNPFQTAVNLLRAATPHHAYEVTGALVGRPTSPGGHGVSIEVKHLPNQSIGAWTFWSSTWQEAIEEAADAVAATVLPRTRRCREPWLGWRRFHLSPKLVHLYESASALTAQRRYDEALARYYEASQLDPKNLDLRLHVGFLQEKLGLFTEALATYLSADEVASEPDHGLYGRRAVAGRRHSHRIVRYRLAILLSGRPLFDQYESGLARAEGEHGRQLSATRQRLGRELTKKLSARSPEPAAVELDKLPATERRVKFFDLAIAELTDLKADMPLKRKRGRTMLTRRAVELSRRHAELRKDWWQNNASFDEPDALLGTLLPPDRYHTWSEHYNAACLLAMPLLIDDIWKDDLRRDRFAQSACEQLVHAVIVSDSGYVARRRDWLVSEDPDLNRLRETEAFKDFEATYLPNARSAPPRPSIVTELELTRYAHALVLDTARSLERLWHARIKQPPEDEDHDAPLAWVHDDDRSLLAVARTSAEHQHWPARLDLIELRRDLGSRYPVPAACVAVPRYADRPLEVAAATNGAAPVAANQRTRKTRSNSEQQARTKIEQHAQAEIDALCACLHQVAAMLHEHAHAPRPQRAGPDETVLRAAQRAVLCRQRKDIWYRAAEKLSSVTASTQGN